MACCAAANGTVHTCCTERNSFASCSDIFFLVHFAWWRGGWRGMLWEDSEKCLAELTVQCRGWVLQSAVRDTLDLHVGRELSVLIDSWNRRRAENGKETSESTTAVLFGTSFVARKASTCSAAGLQMYLHHLLSYPSLFQSCLHPAVLPSQLQAASLL